MEKIIREIELGFYGPVTLIENSQNGCASVETKIYKWKVRKRDYNWIINLPTVIGNHENIVKLDFLTKQTNDSFVWRHEYASYGTLLDHIPPEVGIEESRSKMCCRQIKSALEYLHGKSLVHGDVRPENIYVCDPALRKLKLTGFTFTKLSGSLTIKNETNAPYHAPEIFQKLSNENFPAHYSQDSWSFGIMVFCMLSGSFPWLHAEASVSKDYHKYYEWHKHRTIVVPVSWQKFHPKLHKLLRKLLHPKASKRTSVTVLRKYVSDPWIKQDEDSGFAEDTALSQCNGYEWDQSCGALKELSSKLESFGVTTQGTREWRRHRTEVWVSSTNSI